MDTRSASFYDAPEVNQVARRIVNEAPRDIVEIRDDFPPALSELLFQMLAKKREDHALTQLQLEGLVRQHDLPAGAQSSAHPVDEHVQGSSMQRLVVLKAARDVEKRL
jgi:hypothetical protein